MIEDAISQTGRTAKKIETDIPDSDFAFPVAIPEDDAAPGVPPG